MLLTVTPEQRTPGVPDPDTYERYNTSLSGIWGDLFRSGAQTGLDIVKNRYGVPVIPEGTMIQHTPAGDVLIRQPGGVAVTPMVPPVTRREYEASMNPGTGLMMAAAAVVAVLVIVSTRARTATSSGK